MSGISEGEGLFFAAKPPELTKEIAEWCRNPGNHI